MACYRVTFTFTFITIIIIIIIMILVITLIQGIYNYLQFLDQHRASSLITNMYVSGAYF